MTDRLKGCWVVFDTDYRDDDAECILNAIRQIRGVASVAPKLSRGWDDHAARQQVKLELAPQIEALFDRIFDRKANP